MRKSTRLYGVGVLIFLLGGAGIAENITSGRGSFIISAIIFSIGIGCILMSYVNTK